MGLFASLLSVLFSTAKDLVSKGLSFRLDGTTSTFASFAFALPFYGVLLAVLASLGLESFNLAASFLTLVLLRSLTDSFAEGMKMHALAAGDLSIVALFSSISPLFLLFTSPLITEDVPSPLGVLAVLLVVGGSLLIVYRPSADTGRPQGKAVMLAAGASFFFSLNSCFDRLAVQKGTPAFSGFTMTLVSAMFLLPFVMRRSSVEGMVADWKGLVLRGFLEVAFMVSKLYALQYLQAPYVAGIQRTSLVLLVIGGKVFFREPDFGRRIAASAFILAGVFLIAWL